MPTSDRPEEEVLHHWLNDTPPRRDASSTDKAHLVREVLKVVHQEEETALPLDVLNSCAITLFAARSDLDRLELQLMRAASEAGHSWTVIAETFGFRSKQACHARASSLAHRLEYRTADEDGEHA